MSPRYLIKALIFVFAALLTSPLWVLSWLEKRLTRSEALFTLGAQLCAMVPGHPGYWIRAAYYRCTLEASSWKTHIGFGSLFTHRDAHLGPNVSTGAYCVLGHVRLGVGSRLASRVSIPSGKRQHLDDSGALSDGTQFDTVRIGPGCWIGEGAIVMADIGANSIVGAGAIVTRKHPGKVLISGNPAVVVRDLPAGDAP